MTTKSLTPEERAKQIIEIAPLAPVDHIAFAMIVEAIKDAAKQEREQCAKACADAGWFDAADYILGLK
jgi:hypothetical protein